MSNWGTFASNNEPDDESDLSSYEDSEEEDLPPLQISSWGDNSVVARVNEEGTTEVNVSTNGWASLIDPNHKIAANGLGSGNLHRKGGNYKPVDEEYILNHRLKKGGGLPKAPGTGKKKKKKAAPVSSNSYRRDGGGAPGHHRSFAPPPSSTTRRPPPQSRIVDGSASGWGSQKLADTPFWEQPAAAATSAPAPPPSAPAPVSHQPAFSSGAAASKYATGSAASKYAPQQQQHQQQQHQQPAHHTPAQYGGSGASRYAPQPSYPAQQAPAAMGSASSQYAPPPPSSMYMAPQQQQPVPPVSSPQTFASGASASKYATGSSASKYAPQNTGSSGSIYASPSGSTPASLTPSPPPQRKPILTFNIELVPGVSAPLNVYENSNPVELVNIFEREHNLHMQPVAKETFARNIATLVEHELKKRYGS
ncbi:hypothetical protein BX666DRAFT_2022796 [Dichotomocladium elegans]|nr:hypothetical protein BX666DRAFT_2022796 [Dichotomocladium elegans]